MSCHNAQSLNQVENNRTKAMIQCPHYPVNFVQVGYFIQAIVGTMHVHWQSLQVRESTLLYCVQCQHSRHSVWECCRNVYKLVTGCVGWVWSCSLYLLSKQPFFLPKGRERGRQKKKPWWWPLTFMSGELHIQPTLDSLPTLCSPITLKEVLIMTTKNQDSYIKSTLQVSVHYNWVHFIYMYLTVEVGVAWIYTSHTHFT